MRNHSPAGSRMSHLIDASEISMPAARGMRSFGVGNARASECKRELRASAELACGCIAQVYQEFAHDCAIISILYREKLRARHGEARHRSQRLPRAACPDSL